MLKIGDFSRLAHVTVKTLRFYDRQGLVKPVWVDRFTGYRYYALEQLPRINRVIALKDLGFTLDQIKQMLDESLSAAELRGMLKMKQMELKVRLQNEQQRLARVEMRLEQIEQEGQLIRQEVVLRRIQTQTIATAKTHAFDEMQVEDAREGLRQLINAWCIQKHVRVCGPWLTTLDTNEYDEKNVDIELSVVIEGVTPEKLTSITGPVHLAHLPEIPTAACLLGEKGNIPPLPDLMHWVDLNGYRACGATRLVYLNDEPQTPLYQQGVEVQIPVISLENPNQKEIKMEPVKFVTLPAFKVMGMKYHGKNENQEISVMWGRLNQRAREIPMIGDCAFGVCLMLNDAPGGEFEYVAGFKVDASAVAPDGLLVIDVPENRYAVFEHKGSLEKLGKTYDAICNEWFPRSGMQPTGGYDMEVYDDKFTDFSPESVFYIYEPVK